MGRIIHLLALLALILAPLAMHRVEAAPAVPHHAAAAASHCAEPAPQQPDEDESDRGGAADCALACSAMAGRGAELADAPAPRPAYHAFAARFFAGTAPGSDPPPPRLS